MNTVLWILGLSALITAAFAGISAAPWLPTRKKELNQLIEALHQNPPKQLIDLGCGDGRVLFSIARALPNTVCHGVEISLLPFFIATLRKWSRPIQYRHVHIWFKSLYTIDLSPYDAVITFLLSTSYERLKKKWREELNPQSLLFIQAWPLKDIEPFRIVRNEGILPLYIYQAKDLC